MALHALPTALVAAALTATTLAPVAAAKEHRIQAYTTGYTWYDNTPPGSVVISDPVIHHVTAGSGTAEDPVTVAVGHSLATGDDVLDYPAGTRMYVPALRKYLIVEDTCGDGDTPEKGPCHTGFEQDGTKYPWLDVWLDGQKTSKSASNACASRITDVHTVILAPRAGYAVDPGSVIGSGCHVYGETAVTAAASTPKSSFQGLVDTLHAALT